MKNEIRKLAMKDTARNSLIAIPVIMVFELVMIVMRSLSTVEMDSNESIGYLIGYLSLLVVSAIVLAYILVIRKNIDKNYKAMFIVEHIYALAFVIWALAFTYIGAIFGGNFDYLIYLTIVTMIPVFCYLNPIFWVSLLGISSGFVVYIASPIPHFRGFVINFLVFVIISTIASFSMYMRRYNGYKKEIELEREAKRSHAFAYIDTLTELPNRRSYLDALNKVKMEKCSDLILAMFDINGLKHANDNLGHEAGDELIQGAAKCLLESFSKMGDVYRVGGDEFMGIFHGTKYEMIKSISHLNEITKDYKSNLITFVSISVGFACQKDYPDETKEGLEAIADKMMYAEKDEFYKKSSFSKRLI